MRRHYEFALITIILLILIGVALRFLAEAEKDAEGARLQAEVMSIRAQLMERSVHRETFGGALPESANPMDWIAERPANYRGARVPGAAEVGLWYYDEQKKTLVYRFQNGEEAYFYLSLQGGESARGVPGGIGLVRVEKQSGKVN